MRTLGLDWESALPGEDFVSAARAAAVTRKQVNKAERARVPGIRISPPCLRSYVGIVPLPLCIDRHDATSIHEPVPRSRVAMVHHGHESPDQRFGSLGELGPGEGDDKDLVECAPGRRGDIEDMELSLPALLEKAMARDDRHAEPAFDHDQGGVE